MASRTLQMLVSDVIREVRGQAKPLEAQQAVRDALDVIDSKGNWEFLVTRTLINIVAPYTTGTVAVAAGGTAVTGTGTAFTTAGGTASYKTLKMASRQLPYEVASVGSDTALTLESPVSGTAAITTDAFSLYQMQYALPTDCEPGRDLRLKGPYGVGENGMGDIKKIGAMTFERRRQDYGVSPGGPFWYTDGPLDEVNRVATILVWPYPTASQEFRLTYYRKLTIPTTMTSNIMIPEAFERLPILLAASQIMQRSNTQGWLEKKSMAEQMMKDLYSRHAASPAYDNAVEPDDSGSYEQQFAANNTLFTGFGNY